MVKYVNCGLYNVDLKGTKDEEFEGQHPTLVIRTKEETRVYIAIPFTTFTNEKWQKLKTHMCCRVKSTNSIARIDKVEIINEEAIKNRWMDSGEILAPMAEDLTTVLNKTVEYFRACFWNGEKEINKNYLQINMLKQALDKIFIENNFENSYMNVNVHKEKMILCIGMDKITKVSIKEMSVLLERYVDKNSYQISIINDNRMVFITVMSIGIKMLTLKEKNDKLKLTEG